MKLNKYHKKVLSVALEIFENNGDDSYLDIRDNPQTFKALQELKKAILPPKIKIPKCPKIPKDALTCKPVQRDTNGNWMEYYDPPLQY